jgi:hypothetical protein
MTRGQRHLMELRQLNQDTAHRLKVVVCYLAEKRLKKAIRRLDAAVSAMLVVAKRQAREGEQ